MPWCATAAFPHPLVNIQHTESNDLTAINYYSYCLVDLLTWQGLGHTINKLRMKRLGLDYLTTASAMGMIERCGIPWTYCISPAPVPKPQDWTRHINVVGFYFLELAKGYIRSKDLVEFINSGEPLFYIGFGPIVLDNQKQMTKAILGGTITNAFAAYKIQFQRERKGKDREKQDDAFPRETLAFLTI